MHGEWAASLCKKNTVHFILSCLIPAFQVSYLSVPNAGAGTGFYAIDKKLNMTKLANHSSTYANRMLHPPSDQILIGAWAVDVHGNVKTFDQLLTVRVGGMATHLTDPNNMVRDV